MRLFDSRRSIVAPDSLSLKRGQVEATLFGAFYSRRIHRTGARAATRARRDRLGPILTLLTSEGTEPQLTQRPPQSKRACPVPAFKIKHGFRSRLSGTKEPSAGLQWLLVLIFKFRVLFIPKKI